MVTTLKRAWQRLTGATPCKTQADLGGKYTHFQALLSANNQTLTLMTDREEKLSGDYLFDLQYIRAAVSQLHQETGKLVVTLNGLGGNRSHGLSQALARISREVEEVLTRLALSPQRKGDLIEARLAKYSPEQMADCLTRLGKLTLCINQLDISLVSDSMTDWYVEDFIGQS